MGRQATYREAMAPQCMDRFPGVDQIADLEGDTGEITVTRFLADMAGYDLVPRVVKASTDTINSMRALVEKAAEAR